ncbi:MAG TPA: CvpA family protein [Dissulfurispiraceae bacterium]|nr:CvpA family protein [Dissulfurispiraceae bacterium]
MNIFDIIVLVIIGLTTAFGIWKGMVSQIFSIAGIIGGYFAAVRYYTPLASHMTFMDAGVAKIVSFFLIFVLCIIIAMIIAWLAGKLFKLPGLGIFNSLGGGAVGFIKGFLLIALTAIFLIAVLPHDSPLLQKSATLPYVLKGIKIIDNMIPQDIKSQYHKKIDTVKEKIFKELPEPRK